MATSSEMTSTDHEDLDAAMDALAVHRPNPTSSLGESEGDFINGYHLLKLIDVGGMGEVWKAEQQAPVKRRVALKIVKLGMDTRAVVSRFENERKALARMEHPHIARIFDGGATRTGRPYFVMEYVDGVPITAYVRQAGLSLTARLQLVMQVCDAIEHAHRRGIIHRDLKPKNILVQLVDGIAVPKIIDFGIAKATDSSIMDQTAITGLGQILGTLGYMSPEQTAIDTSKVDTRSDIYSLGAVLYELVTDVLPFDLAALSRKGQEEALNVIRHETPRKPSLLLRQSRGVSQSWMSLMRDRMASHELDWVILKALDKDPERRYASAAQLGEDLERLLQNRPVRARPDSIPYVLRKWVTRHRLHVSALAGMTVLTLVTTLLIHASVSEEIARADERGWLLRLLEAKTKDVPEIIKRRPPLTPHLTAAMKESMDLATDNGAGLHVRLAQMPDPELAEALQNYLLTADADGESILVSRPFLHPFAGIASPRFWEILQNDAENPANRIRAAALLANYAPKDHRWAPRQLGSDVAEQLCRQAPLDPWISLFEPVSAPLTKALADTYYVSAFPEIRRNAATILSTWHPEDVPFLETLATKAAPEQMPPLIGALVNSREAAGKRFASVLTEVPPPGSSESEKDRLAESQARAAIALMHLDQADQVKPYLRHSGKDEDPRLRSFIIDFMAAYQVDHIIPARWITDDTENADIIYAALVALMDYVMTERRIASLEPAVIRLYTDHPHPGVHSAAERLLRKWRQDRNSPTLLPQLRSQREASPDRDWYVTSEGLTMSVVRGPVTFLMGSPADEPGNDKPERYRNRERQHRRHLPRSFALATKPVTVRQFERMDPGHHQRAIESRDIHEELVPHLTEDCPVQPLCFGEAMRYCNWLSRQEGIPADQFCYQDAASEDGLEARPGFLSLTGYRLPTDAEWEYACRAGSMTPRPHGFSERLLPKYEWYEDNAHRRLHPVAMLRPNDLGLFDMLGNALEWTQSFYVDVPTGAATVIDNEEEVHREHPRGDGEDLRPSLRGGTVFSTPMKLRSGGRTTGKYLVTLRVARTIAPPSSPISTKTSAP